MSTDITSVQSRSVSVNPSFTKLAPHYDKLMRGVPYRMWVEYLELLCQTMDHVPHRVLDVCCGTGTVCEMLAARGWEMTGVDRSEEMVRVARSKLGSSGLRIEYYAQDVSELDLSTTFDTALSFFDSLNYITDTSRLREAFRRIASHLEPDGLFVFDLNTAYAFEHKMFDQEVLKRSAPVRYRWRSTYDPTTRICRVHMEFWTSDPEEYFVEEHVQRAHTPEEVRCWLSEAGFSDIRVYHSYTLERPRGTSDRLHFVARRTLTRVP